MRLNVITDQAGNIVAATPGFVAESEQAAAESEQAAAQAGGEGGGGIVLLPGQAVRQIDVPHRLFGAGNVAELRPHLRSA